MYKIGRFDEYKELISENKRRGFKVKTNCFLFAEEIRHYLDEERLYYEKYENGLIIYVDEIRYYTAYYFWNEESSLPVFPKEKVICVAEVDVNNRRREDLKIMSSKLIKQGFIAMPVIYEIVLDLNTHRDEILKQFDADLVKLDTQELSFVFCQQEHIKQVISLWENSLAPTALPYDHLNFWKQEHAKVLCIVNAENVVCCATCWQDDKGTREGRHIATNPLYYRRGLGSILIRAWLVDAINCNITKARAWVAEDNIKSDIMHQKLGFIRSGKTCTQYILNLN